MAAIGCQNEKKSKTAAVKHSKDTRDMLLKIENQAVGG